MARQHYGNFFGIMRAVAPNILNVGCGLGNTAYHGVLALGKIVLGVGEGILGAAPEIKNTVNFGIDGVSNIINGDFCNSGECAFKAVEHVLKAGANLASIGADTMHEIAPDLSSMSSEVYSVSSNIINGVSEVISYTSQASAELSSTYDIIGTTPEGFDFVGNIAEAVNDWILV